MNLDTIRPKNETEDFLLSITKNFEMLIYQTYTKPQETLEFELTQPREFFSHEPSINFGPDSKWLIRFTSLEIYNSFFINTEGKNDIFTNLLDQYSYTELKRKLEEILGVSDITPVDLQNELVGPRIIKT